MNRFIRSLRSALFLLLALPLLAWASPQYLTIGGVSFNQTGLQITDLLNGTKRWVTSGTWTNNNAFATHDLYFVLLNQWVQGTPADANAMQWDNAAGIFRKGNSSADADNEAFYVNLADTNIGAVPAVFSVDATDSLPAFFIGALGAGASAAVQMNFIMTSDVHTMFFNGALVQAVPEPQTLALALMALLALAAARRQRA